MAPGELIERGPLRALLGALGGPLRPGELGLVYARAGVGKSALLVHLALERLLRGEAVFHVSVRDPIQHVRDAYESNLAGLHHALRPLDRAEALLAVERHRVIHWTRGNTPRPAGLTGLLDVLHQVMDFEPRLLVVDGWCPPAEDAKALRELAGRSRFGAWCAFMPGESVADAEADVVLELVPDRGHVWLHVRKSRSGETPAPVRLDNAAFIAREEPEDAAPRLPLRAQDCTLYSGGAHGAEAAFGEAAELWGLREVNFTFAGHVQARSRGAHPLSEQELAAGDVSLAYVSRRLRRGYGEGTMIRRVLQSLWHQVSSAQLVFVIGAIQEDGTVTGGTGWSVELARMWNKRLWVFDQDKDGWFRWNGDDWVAGTPVIDASTFCGTGTRYLTENGKVAIRALLERSFGPA